MACSGFTQQSFGPAVTLEVDNKSHIPPTGAPALPLLTLQQHREPRGVRVRLSKTVPAYKRGEVGGEAAMEAKCLSQGRMSESSSGSGPPSPRTMPCELLGKKRTEI